MNMSSSIAGSGIGAANNNFGLMRLLLAVAVVFSHAFSVATGRIEDEPLTVLTGFTLGEHAVNAFFAISGYLVVMSYDRRGWRDYVLARLLRILPGFVAATFVVAIVMGLALTRLDPQAYLTDPELWRFIVRTLTTFKTAIALPGVFEANPLPFPLGTVWTLKYEVYCYLGVLVAGAAGLLRWRKLALGIWACLVLAMVLRDLFVPESPKHIETTLRLPLIFMTGSLVYLWRERITLSPPSLLVAGLLVVLLSQTPLYKAALCLGTAWITLVLAMAPALTSHNTEPAADLSFGIYLYGWPLQQAFHALFPNSGVLLAFSLALAVTIVVAYLSWRFVEAPALGLKRALMQTGRARPTHPQCVATSAEAATP
jgi:peptidoglycan/LPS O-acetylase OafA/YrhL